MGANVRVIFKYLLGLYGIAFYRREVQVSPCDILFFYTWEGEAARTQGLVHALNAKGFQVASFVLPSRIKIIVHRLLARTERLSSFGNCLYEYFAAYVIARFSPKILLTFDDGSCYTAFLKHEMERRGGTIINIAHGLTGDSESFTNFLFHYYFVFGQSSVDAVLRQKIRYGSTKVIKAGSYLISTEDSLPVNNSRTGILFCSTWLPEPTRALLLKNMAIFAEWANSQTRYSIFVKHHPLEDPRIIREVFRGVQGVSFLPQEICMKDALEKVSLIVTSWSVASLEAALMNRPTVIVNDSDMPDFLEIEGFFLPRARNAKEIQERVSEIFLNYAQYVEKGAKYVERHLAHTTDSVPVISQLIESIFRDRNDFSYLFVPQTRDYVFD